MAERPRAARQAVVEPEAGALAFEAEREAAWIDVIRKMDEVYVDLLRYETELEEKNAELEDAQAFISSVVESVSDILIVCGRNGEVLQINPAARRLLGEAFDVAARPPLASLIDAANGARAAALASADAPDGVQFETRLVTPDGLSDLYAVNAATRRDPSGVRIGAVLTGRPVGELRRAYEALHAAHDELHRAQRQLIEQEKMASLGRLVAGVAHELNNPISFVYGNIHTLERYRQRLTAYLEAIHGGAGADETAALRLKLKIDPLLADYGSLIEGALEGATRIADVVKNLRRLTFAKPGPPQRVEIERVLRTAALWAARARSSRIEIAFAIEPDLAVLGDEGQLHQIVVNLTENAIDAVRGRSRPMIAISAMRRAGAVDVTVADNGAGLPDGSLDRIFEPFFTTKPSGEGTGLGLWISYGLAREHGGALTAANRPEGGAAFTLTLPAP